MYCLYNHHHNTIEGHHSHTIDTDILPSQPKYQPIPIAIMSSLMPSTPTLSSTITLLRRPYLTVTSSSQLPRRPLKCPRPTHFLVHPTGVIVPMVAVDEFPPGTRSMGVARTLGIEATIETLNAGLIKKEKGVGHYVFMKERNRKK